MVLQTWFYYCLAASFFFSTQILFKLIPVSSMIVNIWFSIGLGAIALIHALILSGTTTISQFPSHIKPHHFLIVAIIASSFYIGNALYWTAIKSAPNTAYARTSSTVLDAVILFILSILFFSGEFNLYRTIGLLVAMAGIFMVAI
jgi:uncharacterized membrane protein